MRRLAWIPALRFDALTPLLDPLMRFSMREADLKGKLVDLAGIRDGLRVLDLGCGTATLAIMVKERHAEAAVTGLDPDPRVLRLARAKIARHGVIVDLDQGSALRLPYPEASFDRVLSSFVVHHLDSEQKLKAFREVRRVLRPGGEFHILDFGSPSSSYARLVMGLLARAEPVGDNLAGRIPLFLTKAGFADVGTSDSRETIFGTVVFYRCTEDG